MKKFAGLAMLFFALGAAAQSRGESEIRSVLAAQTESWNRGELEAFMQPYWRSDSLMFIGSKGVVRGWQKTLDNYKKGYPDTAAMGKLAFEIVSVQMDSKRAAFVVGRWTLTRSIGNVGGHFTLYWRRLREGWRIVADHSS